jgi:hypothetical protein
MRGLWVLGALAVGCGARVATVEQPAQQPQYSQASLMSSEEFASRVSGLRATLARSGVAIDTQAVIDSCEGEHRSAKCVRCEVASRENTGGVDPELIDAAAIAFALYPPKLVAATGVKHLALCRTIRILGSTERAPAGVALSSDHRVMISVEQWVEGAPLYRDDSIGQVVHHEMFHLFDHETSGATVYADREWAALNPPGFAYRDPAVDADARPSGFVNKYATTNELEDRATVFEYLLGQPAVLCEIAARDKAVAAKIKTVWKRIAKVTGEKLLRQHASCVESIGKPPPKPNKRSKTRRPIQLQLRSAPTPRW